jgi:hypothetical protein
MKRVKEIEKEKGRRRRRRIGPCWGGTPTGGCCWL